VTGIASISLGIASGYQVGWLGPQYAISRYEVALDSIRENLDNGKAIETRNAIAGYRSAHKFPNPDSVSLLQNLADSTAASK
jgi:hypothetical protein